VAIGNHIFYWGHYEKRAGRILVWRIWY
jgi:hypothetical protein